MKKTEWSKFSVGSPSKRNNWTNPDCVPFSSLDHVTHIKNSLPILIDKRIKSGLVIDQSKRFEGGINSFIIVLG